jgi:hypothetical protein
MADEESHVDVLSAELVTHRNRQHIANHTRSIQEQTLDALLRVEEMAQKVVAHFEAQGITVTRVADEIQVELPDEKRIQPGKRKGVRAL